MDEKKNDSCPVVGFYVGGAEPWSSISGDFSGYDKKHITVSTSHLSRHYARPATTRRSAHISPIITAVRHTSNRSCSTPQRRRVPPVDPWSTYRYRTGQHSLTQAHLK